MRGSTFLTTSEGRYNLIDFRTPFSLILVKNFEHFVVKYLKQI